MKPPGSQQPINFLSVLMVIYATGMQESGQERPILSTSARLRVRDVHASMIPGRIPAMSLNQGDLWRSKTAMAPQVQGGLWRPKSTMESNIQGDLWRSKATVTMELPNRKNLWRFNKITDGTSRQ